MAHATDPLFLFFLVCASFSGSFLAITAVSSGLHGRGVHHGHASHDGGGSHGSHAGHGPDGGHGAHGSDGSFTHHGHHPGTADAHFQTGKHGHLVHADHTGNDAQSGKAGHGAHGDGSGHGGGQRGNDVHDGPPSDRLAIFQRHARWAGFQSLVASSLNVYGLLTFLFHMGLVGILIKPNPNTLLLRVLVPPVIGVVAALAWSAVLARLFGDTAGLITKENSQIAGRQVTVSRAIRAGGTGEVLFTPPGGVFQSIPARSMDGQSIPVGHTAVVIVVRSGIALVERLGLLADDNAEVNADGVADRERQS